MKNPIQEVISIIGGQAKLASEIGVTTQAVGLWKKKGKIPANRVLDIERLVHGRVTRHRLRPDVFGTAEAPIPCPPVKPASTPSAGS